MSENIPPTKPTMEDTMSDKPKCKEKVQHKDTLRYTGRGRSGFEMHYIEKQCTRNAGADGYCWQHSKDLDARLKRDGQAIQTRRSRRRR